MAAAVVLLALAGCRGDAPAGEMSDADIIKVLDVKINRHPDDAELLFRRGTALLREGRVNEAITDLARAAALDGREYRYHMALGDAYFANGDVEHSYGALQDALALRPGSTEAYLKMGEIAYYSRDYDRAMDNLGRVTAAEPDNRTALFMKGFIYKETGDTANAAALLRKVCDFHPDYAPAFEELGVLYARRQNPMAVEYLSTAHRLDPANTNVLYALAMYYQEGGRPDLAEEAYKGVLDIDGGHKHAWHNRGYIQLFTYGDYGLAAEYLTRAIQSDSAFIEAWTNRGYARHLMGDDALAGEDFRRALDLDHTYQPAIDGLASIR